MMRETFDVGRLFFTLYTQAWKQFQVVTSQEVEEPYRRGHGVAIRVWKHRAVVIGWWSGDKTYDEDEGVRRSMGARHMDLAGTDIGEW